MSTTFPLHIVTLDKTVHEGEVEQVTLPTRMGMVTVLAHHMPLVALVTPGEVVIKKDNTEIPLAVSKGVLEVRHGGEVYILTDTAERAEEIDLERAQAARERAEQALLEKEHLSDVDFARFESKVAKELARIRVGKRRRR